MAFSSHDWNKNLFFSDIQQPAQGSYYERQILIGLKHRMEEIGAEFEDSSVAPDFVNDAWPMAKKAVNKMYMRGERLDPPERPYYALGKHLADNLETYGAEEDDEVVMDDDDKYDSEGYLDINVDLDTDEEEGATDEPVKKTLKNKLSPVVRSPSE